MYNGADMKRMIRAMELHNRGSSRGITGLGRSSFYRAVKDRTFPAPVLIGPRSVAWESEAVEKWLASRPTRNSSGA
jgi:prophage regulatory protein